MQRVCVSMSVCAYICVCVYVWVCAFLRGPWVDQSCWHPRQCPPEGASCQIWDQRSAVSVLPPLHSLWGLSQQVSTYPEALINNQISLSRSSRCDDQAAMMGLSEEWEAKVGVKLWFITNWRITTGDTSSQAIRQVVNKQLQVTKITFLHCFDISSFGSCFFFWLMCTEVKFSIKI